MEANQQPSNGDAFPPRKRRALEESAAHPWWSSTKQPLDPASMQEYLQFLFDEFDRQMERKNEVIQILMERSFRKPRHFPAWKDIPSALKKDTTCMAHLLRSENYKLHGQDCDDLVLGNRRVFFDSVAIIERDGLHRNKICQHWDSCLVPRHVDVDPLKVWKPSEEIAMEAFSRGLVQHSGQTPMFTLPKMAEALACFNGIPLRWLPDTLKSDESFWRNILDPDSFTPNLLGNSMWSHCLDRLFAYLKELHPHLYWDKQIWVKLLENKGTANYFRNKFLHPFSGEGHWYHWYDFSEDFERIVEYFWETQCKDIHDDLRIFLRCMQSRRSERLVQKMLAKRPTLVLALSPRWLNSPDSSFITANKEFFLSMLRETRHHADEVITLIYEESMEEHIEFQSFVGMQPILEMWNDREFTKLWFTEAGLPLCEGHPEHIKDDPQIFRAIAEHGASRQLKMYSFVFLPESLAEDADFFSDVMKLEPGLFEFASESLHKQHPLFVWALTDVEYLTDCLDNSEYCEDFCNQRAIQDCLKKALKELVQNKSFVTLLCGVRSADRRSPLDALNQEKSVLQAIGNFVGLPGGDHLVNLRRFVRNVETEQPRILRRTANGLGIDRAMLHY
jgi:hypothetical protein